MSTPRSVLIALGATLAFTACSKSPSREAYAVGTYIGGGSVIFGSSHCTYEGPSTVIGFNGDGREIGELIGPGEVIEDCKGTKTTYDVLAPTGVRIAGPAHVPSGKSRFYSAVAVAGSRTLTGDGPRPAWTLGPDCNGIAQEIPDSSAQDTGGRSSNLELEGTAKGTCTLTTERFGYKATLTVKVD